MLCAVHFSGRLRALRVMALSTFVDTDDFVQTRAEWRGCLAEKVYCRGLGKQGNAVALKR